jgi:hypothetical protein
MNYNGRQMHYFRRVTLPDDARVYVEDEKMKADKFILGEREPISTSRELFDQLLQNLKRNYVASVVFHFDRSFYDEHAWITILKTTGVRSYQIPGIFKMDMVRDIALTLLEKGEIIIYDVLNALGSDIFQNDAIVEKLIANGLNFVNIPRSCETRQVLRCFLRMEKFDQARFFPSALFLDETLLDGILDGVRIHASRELRQLVTEKKKEIKDTRY